MATYYEEEKKGGGFAGKLLAVFLGFLFGIIVTIGSIAGVGYYLYAKMRIREGINLVGQIMGNDIKYQDYITDEYADKTVAALLKDLQSLASSFSGKTITLDDLNRISPQVEKKVTDLANQLETQFNIPLTVTSPNKDEAGNILDDADNVILDKDGNVVKKDENGKAVLTGDNGEMMVGLMDVPLSLLLTFFTQTLNPLELGTVLASPKLNLLSPSSGNFDILMLLCYGDDTNYEKNADGTVMRDENGNAVMKNGAEATTIGDLLSSASGQQESGGIISLLKKISASGILSATDSLDNSDPLVRSLLYGTEGKQYTYDADKNEITWLPVTYRLDGETNVFSSSDGTEYAYRDAENIWVSGSGESIRPATAQPGTGNADAAVSYSYIVYDADEKAVCSLLAEETEAGLFYAYLSDGELLYNSPRSLKELMYSLGGKGGNVMDLLADVELGTLLGLSDKEYNDDNKMLFALAYGSLGEDFILENGKVVMINGSKPTTVGQLTGGSANELLERVTLDSLMTVDRTDSVMCALVYGTEGKHYVWPEGDAAPTMLPVKYSVSGGILYDDEGNRTDAVWDEASGVWTVTKEQDGETEIFYAKAESDGSAVWLYASKDCSGEKLLYQKMTLGALLDGPEDLIDGIQLSAVLSADPDDAITMYLLYGKKGVHYDLDGETGEVIMLRREVAIYDGKAYDERGELLPGSLGAGDTGYIYTEGNTTWILTEQSGNFTEISVNGESVKAPCYYAATQQGGYVFYQPHTIGDLSESSSLLSNIKKDLTIGDIMGETGTSGLIASIADWKIDDLNDQDKIMSLKIGDVMGIDENSSKLLLAMEDWTLNDLNDQDKIMSLKLADVIEIDDETSPGFLKAIRDKNWTLNDLNDKDNVNSLRLGEVIEIDENDPDTSALLLSLKDTSIGDLTTRINTLTPTEILGEEDVENNRILRHLRNSTVLTLSADIENLSIAAVFEDDVYKKDAAGNFVNAQGEALYLNPDDGIYYTTPDYQADTQSERVMTGSWEYLLTDPDGLIPPSGYALTDMETLTRNMTVNIQNAALNDLYKNEIILLEDSAFLEKPIIYEYTVGEAPLSYTIFDIDPAKYDNKSKLGELTINQMINYVTDILTAIS